MARLSLLLALAAAVASPVVSQCTSKSQRKAWHTYTDDEKKAYIDAELCLMEKEPILGLDAPAKNRHEELQALHILTAGITHGTGAFLPFHRLLMHAHEVLLQTECGYGGTQPYWDISQDIGNLEDSAVVDPDTGFGGNGGEEDGCIQDGPFAGYVNSLGPGYTYSDSCIRRNFNETYLILGGDDFLKASYKRTKHEEADPYIQAGPHNSGHCAIGGLMSDPVASPGDPIFYLHHTWLDKVFWDWQSQDLPARLEDIGLPNGLIIFDPTNPPPQPPALEGDPYMFPIPAEVYPAPEQLVPLPDSPPQVPSGDPGNVTTLDHVLDMYGIIPNATIGEVLDIQGGLLCYEYV